MHPRRAHALQATDGAGEFPLQRAQAVHILLERGGGEGVAAVEQFPPHAAASGQAVARQQQPRARHLRLRHQDLRSAGRQTVRDARAFQCRHHRRRIARLELAVEGGHHRLARPQSQPQQEAEDGKAHGPSRSQTHGAEGL